MTTRYSQIRIAMDLFNEAPRFAPAGQSGDRFERFISFEGDLPVPVPEFQAPPRVVITPVRKAGRDGEVFNLVTPVCVARDITVKGFRLAAYNQDPDFGGRMAFDWVAIDESPDQSHSVPKLMTGVLPPIDFAPFRESFLGNRTFHDHDFAGFGLFDASGASVQLTSTDKGVQGHSVAAIGIVDNPEDLESRIAMTAHNIDIAAGGCAFNWATFSLTEFLDPSSIAEAAELNLETGEVAERWFEPGGQTGDWHTWNIPFQSRFREAPVVLLTATKKEDVAVRLTAAVMAIAQAVTTSGFRLAARSCDLLPGLTGFNWIAIGQAA